MRSEIETGFHTIWICRNSRSSSTPFFLRPEDTPDPHQRTDGRPSKKNGERRPDHQKYWAHLRRLINRSCVLKLHYWNVQRPKTGRNPYFNKAHPNWFLLRIWSTPDRGWLRKKGRHLKLKINLPLENLDIDFNIVSEVLYNLSVMPSIMPESIILFKTISDLSSWSFKWGWWRRIYWGRVEEGQKSKFQHKKRSWHGFVCQWCADKKASGNLTIQNTSKGEW